MAHTRFPADAARVDSAVRGGANAVHGYVASVARAFRPPPPALVRERRGVLAAVAALTALIGALTLVQPAIALALIDRVLRDGAHVELAALIGAGGLAVVLELMLRRERSALAADQGVRLAAAMAAARFRALMARDVRASGPISTQVSQYRRLRRLRRLLTGPVVTAAVDAPVAMALTGLLIAFAGPMGLVPMLAALLHALAAGLLHPYVRRTAVRGGRARELLRVALAESSAKRDTLDELGMQTRWAERVEALAIDVAERRRDEGLAEAAVDAAAHGIALLAIVAALWIGAAQVMAGDMSVGAAVAAMLLAWRCSAPLETLARSWADLSFALEILRRRTAQTATRASHPQAPRIRGHIVVRGLVVASEGAGPPALRGVCLDVSPGEVVAVCGPSGAGKSMLLMALLGMARPQAGSVVVDGADLRAVDESSYRMQIGWAPQRTTLFHGTVAQNVRLLAPAADEAGITLALRRAGIRLPHPQLPQALDTRLKSGGGGQIDESLRAKIMLAGLYAKEARLYLLDDPGAFLDGDGDRALLNALAALRGRATVIIATNRPSHMRACDRIVRLEHGMIVTDGPATQVLGA